MQRLRLGSLLGIGIACALLLAPLAASGQVPGGYWRLKGPTQFVCPGRGTGTIADCRVLENVDGAGMRIEILDYGDDHATFRVTQPIGGLVNITTFRDEWALPPIVVPGAVVGISTRGTVVSIDHANTNWNANPPYNVPGAQWIGWGGVNPVIDGVINAPATSSGLSQTLTNATKVAGVPGEGYSDATLVARVHVHTMPAIEAYVPYTWVGGTPPVLVAPTFPPRVFYNGNIAGVSNGAKAPSFTFDTAVRLKYLMTYHWNGGRGAPAGTLALISSDGTLFGPWQATLGNKYYW